MAKQGIDILQSLRRKWISYQLLADVLLALSCALILQNTIFLANKITFFFLPPLWFLLPLFLLSFLILIAIQQPWRRTLSSVAQFLDQNHPELEESTELLIKNTADLTLLQKLQRSKVELAIRQVPIVPKLFLSRVKIALVYLLTAAILTVLAAFVQVSHYVIGDNLLVPPPSSQTVAEKKLPQINAVGITISPPAYTGAPKRDQDKFTISAEEGSTVDWTITTNIAVGHLSLLFNDGERVALMPGKDHMQWTAHRILNKPGFYQVDLDDKLSDLYQIEIIKDNPPLIQIKDPKQYTYIDAGEAQKIDLHTTITDDHGISTAMIYATVAKGSGEAVKFKEYKIGFDEAFATHRPKYDLQHLFDLPKLEMGPGDELYFYVEATDNHQQKSRTDVYTVSIQDTAALLSMAGLVNGSNVKPEYFRSQRQIIMDTEQLLKQKDSLSNAAFNSLCNNIGIDQKMLRLRYGHFLGEEEEENVSGLTNSDELNKVENFSNGDMLRDAITDKHDNAEDATFFDPGIKAQLKATLTEMWNAELHLRLYKPQEALPFEYKALRLLKDLQQRSRAYVAKTAYNPTPLKLEKRLTGELDKVTQPVNKEDVKPKADQFKNIKTALQILEQLKTAPNYTSGDKRILQLARQQLGINATKQPGVYLSAINAVNRILATGQPQIKDINLAERGLQKALPQISVSPQKTDTRPDMGLAQHYYRNIKNNHQE